MEPLRLLRALHLLLHDLLLMARMLLSLVNHALVVQKVNSRLVEPALVVLFQLGVFLDVVKGSDVGKRARFVLEF